METVFDCISVKKSFWVTSPELYILGLQSEDLVWTGVHE